MNATTPSLSPANGSPPLRVPAPLSSWSVVLRVLLVCGITLVCLVGLTAWSFAPRGEVRELRRLALEQLPGTWKRQVEIRVGGTLCSMGEIAATLAGAPPEAVAILDCVDSAEVSVHQRTSRGRHGDAEEATGLLDAATQSMAARGWDPLVRVRSRHETVAVFLAPASGKDRIRLCVLVHDGNDLVVAACQGRVGPLLQILNTKSFREKIDRKFAGF